MESVSLVKLGLLNTSAVGTLAPGKTTAPSKLVNNDGAQHFSDTLGKGGFAEDKNGNVGSKRYCQG